MNAIGTEIGYSQRTNGFADCAASPRREPEISVELSRLNETVDVLEKSLAEHYQRISPALRQEPQAELSGGTKDEHRASAVGSALQTIRQRIQRITANLCGTTSMLEL